MRIRILLLVFFSICFCSEFHAQKQVLGIPEAFKRPVDDRSGKLINETADQSRKREWWVMSDRVENPIYSKPDINSKIEGQMEFKEYFLVTDNRQDWVEIAKYQTVENLKPKDKLEVLGWVPKSNLLLWSAALRDPVTKIERKAFLLNNKKDIMKQIKGGGQNIDDINYKKIFDAPDGTKLEDTEIYQFYFVYKKVRTTYSEWYLLGSDSKFNWPARAAKGIIGWVNIKDLTTWNTNLCLEPNYESEAYNERKSNDNIKVRTFEDYDALKGASTSNPGNLSKIYMDSQDGSDVVDFMPGEKAKSNPMRHKGKVMRYPYLSQGTIGGTPYYKTGQIGSLPVGTKDKGFDKTMSEIDLSELSAAQVQMEKSLDELNLFFVIDGTQKMGSYKSTLNSALRSLEDNMSITEPGRTTRYGAMIYRKLGNGDKEFELIQPTIEFNQFMTQIESVEFANAFGSNVSNAQGTLLELGVKKGMRAANFSPNAMNMLVVIGNEGDVSFNRNNNVPPQYEISDAELSKMNEDLAKLGVSVHSIQIVNSGSPMDRAFRIFTFRELILESAKTELNLKKNQAAAKKILEDGVLQDPNPTLKKGYNRNQLSSFKAGYNFYGVGPLSADSLAKYINKVVYDYTEERTIEVEITRKLIRGLEAFDQGSFSEQFGVSSGTINDRTYAAITEIAAKAGVSIESVLQSFDQKLDLFQEVYIPVQPEGAKYPSCKFVVFMTDEHLVDYRNTLRTGLRACKDNNAGSIQKRDAVQDMLEKMLEVFIGDSKLEDEFREIDPDEYATKVKGIEDILAFETPLMKNLNDIQNSRKVSDEDLEEIIDRCQRIYDGLEALSSSRIENQDFVLMTANNKYFWLTLDQIY